MKNAKRILALSLSLAMFISTGVIASANEFQGDFQEDFQENFQEDSIEKFGSEEKMIQYQLDGFEKIDEEIRKEQLNNGTKSNRSPYPRRPGVILVTTDGVIGTVIGHAGIVYNWYYTIESNPGKGVQYNHNNWDKIKERVYGLDVKGTSDAVDENASLVAKRHIGKEYNWELTNFNKTGSFYCSQLVYRGYLDAAGKNLNYMGGIVFPMDLVRSNHTTTIYTKGV